MYLINTFAYNAKNKKYAKKSASLQVHIKIFSGVAYRLICWTSMELKLSSDVTKWRIAQYVYRVQPTLF